MQILLRQPADQDDQKTKMLKVTKAGYHGILLPELGLGLDYSGTKAEHIFISHAHADHVPRNKKLSVYATPPTAQLMKWRGFGGEVKPLEFKQTLETDKARITFIPPDIFSVLP